MIRKFYLIYDRDAAVPESYIEDIIIDLKGWKENEKIH
jgi:hypothetical protein